MQRVLIYAHSRFIYAHPAPYFIPNYPCYLSISPNILSNLKSNLVQSRWKGVHKQVQGVHISAPYIYTPTRYTPLIYNFNQAL